MGAPSFLSRPTSGLLLCLPSCGPDSPICELIRAALEQNAPIFAFGLLYLLYHRRSTVLYLLKQIGKGILLLFLLLLFCCVVLYFIPEATFHQLADEFPGFVQTWGDLFFFCVAAFLLAYGIELLSDWAYRGKV